MTKIKTELEDRVLRFDGISEIDPTQVARFMLRGIPSSKLRVTGETADIISFNEQVPPEDRLLLVQPEPLTLDMEWQLDPSYLEIDLEEYVGSAFEHRLPMLDYTDAQVETAINRIADELQEIHQRGMVEFTQTVIYILDTMKQNDLVWGVGRGSSCASYVLFLLGLHVVDCVKMDISMEEFFHE